MKNEDYKTEYLQGRMIERERTLDEIWEWIEIEVECSKPNPVLSQLAGKIIKMRSDTLVL